LNKQISNCEFFDRLDPSLTDDERNAKTSHLSMLIHEEERKRESYRVCFLPIEK